MEAVQTYIENNKERFLEELIAILKIPSISADPAHAVDVKKAAAAMAEALQEAGLETTQIFETEGHPIVFGEKKVNPSWPTVLVYGHYDVQPPDPIELWESPPFEPVIKKTETHPNGAIYARGACDDKGQVFMHIKAIEAMLKHDSLRCNVKFLLEGEEEVGSENLAGFCHEHREILKCDVVLISDTSIISNETPSITSGLRGLCYVEVTVTGANRDLHSGVYGGAVANPINVLSQMIASLHDEDQRITIPGFYDKVQELSQQERVDMNKAPHDEEAYKRDLGIEAVMGESGYTTLERTSVRPTLDVNGIWGGYISEGAKTVLPSKAHAKISMRLVPDQDPDEIVVLFTDHFKAIAPDGVKVDVRPHHHGRPAVTPVDSVEYKAASMAMEQTFGKKPIPARGGGSIPIVSLFEEELGVKSVLMGFGLDSDAIHSPNEHYGIFNFYQGIRTIPYFYQFYGELKNGQYRQD